MICSYTVGSRKAEAWQSEGQGQSPWPQVLLQCWVVGYHRCFCMTGVVKLCSWASQKVVGVAAAAAQNKWICFCRTSLNPCVHSHGPSRGGLESRPALCQAQIEAIRPPNSAGVSQAETVFLGQRHATQERRTGM